MVANHTWVHPHTRFSLFLFPSPIYVLHPVPVVPPFPEGNIRDSGRTHRSPPTTTVVCPPFHHAPSATPKNSFTNQRHSKNRLSAPFRVCLVPTPYYPPTQFRAFFPSRFSPNKPSFANRSRNPSFFTFSSLHVDFLLLTPN